MVWVGGCETVGWFAHRSGAELLRPHPVLWDVDLDRVVMILPQVHLRKPCYDFTFL